MSISGVAGIAGTNIRQGREQEQEHGRDAPQQPHRAPEQPGRPRLNSGPRAPMPGSGAGIGAELEQSVDRLSARLAELQGAEALIQLLDAENPPVAPAQTPEAGMPSPMDILSQRAATADVDDVYTDPDWIADHPDLDSLRNDPDWIARNPDHDEVLAELRARGEMAEVWAAGDFAAGMAELAARKAGADAMARESAMDWTREAEQSARHTEPSFQYRLEGREGGQQDRDGRRDRQDGQDRPRNEDETGKRDGAV
jgi:hypothetical protein